MSIDDFNEGDKLTSKSGTLLIFKKVSEEHTWCVICEYEEDVFDKRYPKQIKRLKGESGYFEPCDLFPR